jgi:ankyrin repeat protein
VELLVAKDSVDPDSKDIYSWTPLSWAAENRHKEVVKLLRAKDGVDLDFKDTIKGQTLLLWADSTDG